MFRVTFHEFRCWENLVIEAPVGGITLIKGNSGVGKTTILQGITWCLYGNIRLVTPNHLDKAKTKVTIECPYTLNGMNGMLVVERQKNPNRFLVSHQGLENTYEDKVAQALINDIFGNYDIWLASCYIGQGCRNSFLTAPNTGKMDLLNSIAFHEEDPTTYIERIDTVITETDSDYKGKLAIFTNNLNSFQSILSTTDISKALTPDQVASVNSQIDVLRREYTNLQIQKNQRDVNLGMLGNLQRQLAQVVATKITFPEADESLLSLDTRYGFKYETVTEVEATISKVMEVIPLLQRRDQLQAEIKKLDSLLLPYTKFSDQKSRLDYGDKQVNLVATIHSKETTNYTMDDYQDAVSKEVAFRDNQKLAQSLGVLYSETAIKDLIQKHRNILASQEKLKLERERDTLRSRIELLEIEHLQQATPIKFPDLTPQQIPIPDYSKYSTNILGEELTELSKNHGAIQAHIQHLQKGKDVIQCPQCKGSLRYQKGELVLAETGPANLDELNISEQQLRNINTEISRVNRIIQSLTAAESADRAAYEHATAMEQRRLDVLRERNKQLELEKQRRDIANQARSKQIIDLKEELTRLSDKILALPEITYELPRKLLSNIEIEQTHTLIGRLSNISILSPPKVTSQYIQSYLNYQDLLQKITCAVIAYQDYIQIIPSAFSNETICNIQTYIDKLRGYLAKIKEASEESIRLERLRSSLEDQIRSITDKIGPDLTDEINQKNYEMLELQQSLSLSVKAHQAIQYHAQITREREDVINLNNTLGDLQTLRQHAVETECRILQEVVDSINASIQGVCGTLFDRDINITLSLFKTLKTTKNVKPVANFSISYQGGNFDNINQMSGGEGDRASLALTLALNRLSSCPILMLDESLASLDLNMKEAAIRTIRENTNNTVFVIMHDGVEGQYQNVISVDEITQGRY